MFHNHSKY